MKSSGFKTEYILLSIVIIALLIYLFLRNPDRIQYEIPDVDLITIEEVSKLEIIKSSETIAIEKKDSAWFILPQGYQVDSEKINKILDEISSFTLTDVISESSSSYSKYGLDQKEGILIRIYGQKGMMREFTIGKQAATFRHTYVKILNDDRVFQARNSFRSQFDQTIDNLRNKNVLKFDLPEIKEIELKQGKESLSFSRQMEKIEVKAQPAGNAEIKTQEKPTQSQEVEFWAMPDGTRAKTEAIKNLIREMSNLSCLKFIEGKSKSDFTDHIYSIVLKGNLTYTLTIFKKTKDEDNSYPAITSVSSYPFFLSSYKAENLMKKPEDILQKANK